MLKESFAKKRYFAKREKLQSVARSIDLSLIALSDKVCKILLSLFSWPSSESWMDKHWQCTFLSWPSSHIEVGRWVCFLLFFCDSLESKLESQKILYCCNHHVSADDFLSVETVWKSVKESPLMCLLSLAACTITSPRSTRLWADYSYEDSGSSVLLGRRREALFSFPYCCTQLIIKTQCI